MSRIYGRRYQVQVGDGEKYLDLEMRDESYNNGQALRITFLVQHEIGGYLSFAEISIFNLKRENEEAIFEKFRSITLQAGYPELFGPIFKGEVINVQRIPVGNTGTRGIKLFCRSSAKAVSYNVVNQSLGPSASAVEIIRACAQAIGNPVIFHGDFSDVPKRSRGTVLQGDPVKVLNKLQASLGFTWTIENNVTVILRNGYQVEGDMFVFSARTGMKGSPVVTDTEISVRVALNPIVQLGRKIKIESVAPEFAFSGAYFNSIPRSIGEGVYQVTRIVHVGDSHGQDWETQLNSLRLDASDQSTLAARISQ
jgi:hypothetical protein